MIILIFGVINGLLFLEETHAEIKMKQRRDWGLELGQLLIHKITGTKAGGVHDKFDLTFEHERDSLTEDDPPPGYRSTEGSPRLQSTTPSRADIETLLEKENRGMVKTFSRPVVLIIVGYAILA